MHLIKLYGKNYEPLGPTRLCTFTNSLAELGLGFSELQVTKTAAECGLFPYLKGSFYGSGVSPLPQFQPDLGEFGQANYHNNRLVGWESLRRSRHVKDTVRGGWFFQGIAYFYSGLG